MNVSHKNRFKKFKKLLQYQNGSVILECLDAKSRKDLIEKLTDESKGLRRKVKIALSEIEK